MKKLSITLSVLFYAILLNGQSPQAFKYQTVVRDNTGEILLNQAVGIRISIHDTTSTGTIVYQETFSKITNQFGLVNLKIGTGTPTIGTFAGINWSNNSKFFETELDPTGGTSYVSMGISQMLSVPYALYAENITNAVSEINDLSDARSDTMSVFLGLGAGENDNGNNYNTVLGIKALHLNTDRSGLVAVGNYALFNNGLGATGNLFATSNTALGSKSMFMNTTGSRNTATGFQSLYSNTTGEWNTASGYLSMYSNTSGYENTAIGYQSMYWNTTGHHNTASGLWSMYLNSTGNYNTSSGSQSLYSNTTGYYNMANGYESLYSNTTGHHNTASGVWSLYANTTGSFNTASGFQSLFSNTTGYENTASGARSLYSNTDGFYNTANGFESLYSNTIGHHNTASGYQALHSNVVGHQNTASGYQSLYNNTTGWDNTANGFHSLHVNTTGKFNTASGSWTLYLNTTGHGNTASGYQSLYWNTTGDYRTALGMSANSTGDNYNNNTGLGYNANCTASDQVRIGNYDVTSIGGYANWTNVSDLRFKDNISEDVEGLSFIQKLRPVTYNLDLNAIDDFFAEHYNERDSSDYDGKYDKENIRYTGFIAQEVEQAATESGYDFSGVDKPKNEDDFYGLRYAEFVVPLVKGMQEQQEMIEKQQELIEKLNAENTEFRIRIEVLENR